MLKLRSYQKDGVAYLRKNKGGALFWEMRLGKSITTIRYLKQLPNARILILAPYAPLEGWKAELLGDGIPEQNINLWYDTTEMRWFNVEQTSKKPGWYLFNKEAPVGRFRVPLESYSWDAVVLDESTFIASPQAQITGWALKVAEHAKIKIILTGTPAPETPLQYYCQISFINKNLLPYKNYWDFRAKAFYQVGFDFVMKLEHKKKLSEILNRFCSVLKRSDVGLAKEKIYEKRFVMLSSANRKRYNSAERDWITGGPIEEAVVLKYAGARWDELRRICGGPEKIKALAELLDGELKGQRALIIAWYVEEVDRIADTFDCKKIHRDVKPANRETIRKEFLNDKEKRPLVIQPEVWKFGVNLVGVDVVIFFSTPCGLLTRQQIEERAEDLSQGGSTLIIDLVCKDTADEAVLESLYLKESENKMMERLRRQAARRTGIGVKV